MKKTIAILAIILVAITVAAVYINQCWYPIEVHWNINLNPIRFVEEIGQLGAGLTRVFYPAEVHW